MAQEQSRGNTTPDGEPITDDVRFTIDALYQSPKERADKVWTAIAPLDFNVFDLLCFSLAFSANCALGLGDNVLLEYTQRALKRLNQIHYSSPVALYGQPEREQTDGILQVKTGGREDAPVSRSNNAVPSNRKSPGVGD